MPPRRNWDTSSIEPVLSLAAQLVPRACLPPTCAWRGLQKEDRVVAEAEVESVAFPHVRVITHGR